MCRWLQAQNWNWVRSRDCSPYQKADTASRHNFTSNAKIYAVDSSDSNITIITQNVAKESQKQLQQNYVQMCSYKWNSF